MKIKIKSNEEKFFILLKFKIIYPQSLLFWSFGRRKAMFSFLSIICLLWFSIFSWDKIANLKFPGESSLSTRFSNPLAFICIFWQRQIFKIVNFCKFIDNLEDFPLGLLFLYFEIILQVICDSTLGNGLFTQDAPWYTCELCSTKNNFCF